MTDQQPDLFHPEARNVMTTFIANSVAPRSSYRISNLLTEYSDADLLAIMAVSNFYKSRSMDTSAIGGFISGDDMEYIRLVAEHMDTLDALNTKFESFNHLRLALERLGVMPVGAGSFPELKQHLEVEELSFLGKTSYHLNDALIIFVHENLHRHEEVIKYMCDNKTQDIGKLRGHFYGEAPVLTPGTL
jgi:hypothetical protein